MCTGSLNQLDEGEWQLIIAALSKGCTSLKEICDFEWSKFLLDPSNWHQQPQATKIKDRMNPATVRNFEMKALDLHGMGLGEKKAVVVLDGLLPRIATDLERLNLRCHGSVCSSLRTLIMAPLIEHGAQL